MSILISSLFNLNNNLLDGLLSGFIVASVTLLLVRIAWKELDKMVNINSADFIYRLKNDFFTEETRNLITLIDLDAIRFVNNNGIVYFEVIEKKLKDFPEEIIRLLTQKKFYSPYEIDDLLLGHFEDIGLFVQKGVVDIEMAYKEFDWYVKTTYENDEIQKYITHLREFEGGDIYDKFEYLYQEFKKLGKLKREKIKNLNRS